MKFNEPFTKGSDITVNKMVKNILAVYGNATETNKEEGAQWYLNANKIATEMSIAYGVTVDKAAAVIAHMSPQCMWARNVSGAHLAFQFDEFGGYLTNNIDNAKRAIASDDPLSTLNGKKVKSFAANILLNTNEVTVDVWALRVAMGDTGYKDNWRGRKGFYEAVAHAYRIAAKRIVIEPSTMQAICWVVKRNGRSN